MATVKKIGDMTLNDGKGLYDNDGLIDSIIINCNDAIKNLVSGQYIAFCFQMDQMAQKLNCLKKGVVTERNDLTEKIEALKQALKNKGE